MSPRSQENAHSTTLNFNPGAYDKEKFQVQRTGKATAKNDVATIICCLYGLRWKLMLRFGGCGAVMHKRGADIANTRRNETKYASDESMALASSTLFGAGTSGGDNRTAYHSSYSDIAHR